MDDITRDLYSRLKKGQVFLFLGQNYLKLEAGQDPFLEEVIHKYGNAGEGSPSYFNLFEGEAQNSVEDSLAWMQARCMKFSIPGWINTISDYAWSGVYTSAIDTIWYRAFHKEWREVQPVFEEKYNPSNPRNPSKLHCTFLFGCIDRVELSERVSLTKRDYAKRKLIALTFARRLPEMITPFGTLLIEGYQGETDWFSADDFLSSVIDDLFPCQAHIFSTNASILKNPYAASLIQEGKLTFHEESLATFLVRGNEAGLIKLGQSPEDIEFGKHIRIGELILNVPISIWNRVSRSALILDESVILSPKPLSNEALYQEFRFFLAESGIMPVWSGYARGFAFKREYQSLLTNEVEKKLKQKILHDEPILLIGQTGTGKTIALGQLAYDIRKEGVYPVLFIEGKTKRPVNSDIDAFCTWLDNEWSKEGKIGAPTTLIISDANDISQYYDLVRYLSGRGHRVVLVGSCYKQEYIDYGNIKFVRIEAPIQISTSEAKEFVEFLNKFEPSLGTQLTRFVEKADSSFLVALYRLLPSTRSMIKTGVIKEYDQVEKDIARIVHGKLNDSNTNFDFSESILCNALIRSGLFDGSSFLSEEVQQKGGEQINETQQLVGLVMVPGSLNLGVPFELLLRTLKRDSIRIFSDLLTKFDIFQWYIDANENSSIGPRNSLEANLWVKANIGGPKYETEYVKDLLFNVKDTGEFFENPEIQFAVDLVRNMGPNNFMVSTRYSPYFKEISETLRDLREKRNIKNPRLMLQEVTLLREYVANQSKLGTPLDDTEQLLDKAELIIQDAIELLGGDKRNKPIFLGELASVLGTKFAHTIYNAHNVTKALRQFEDTRKVALQAWRMDPERSFIPIDILSWTTRDLLKNEDLDPRTRYEAQSDILHAFDIADVEDFDIINQAKLQRRRMEIGQLIGKTELTEDAFNKLDEMGSSAGYYLMSKQIAEGIPLNKQINDNERAQCKKAVDYLQRNYEKIFKDGRSMYLLLRLWWMMKIGKPMFYGEKQVLSFTQEDWVYCQRLLTELSLLDEIYSSPKLLYLRGLAAFHLDEIRETFEIFRQLERESDFRTGQLRIIRSYLASTNKGEPRKYIGEVRWFSDDLSKGGIYIPEIRKEVIFFHREFRRPDIRRGDSFDFYLAFNFLGPICQSI